MLRAQAKGSLRQFRLYDMHIDLKNRSHNEVTTLAQKLVILNFPRVIKQCLVNLPTSLQEPELEKRSNLIKGVRELYHSGEDKRTFDIIESMNHPQNGGIYVDNVVGVFYSSITQLPECYALLKLSKQWPKKFSPTLANNFNTLMSDEVAKSSKLFQLLEAYNLETDEIKDHSYDTTSTSTDELSSDEKDSIFDTVNLTDNTNTIDTKILKSNMEKMINLISDEQNNKTHIFNHMIVRGELCYTELQLNNIVYGCGLDFSHTKSSLRLAKMASLNPKFKDWLQTTKHDTQDKFSMYKKQFLDLEITA